MLVERGIAGILNFSPAMLSVPDHVMVKNVNLAIELENLSTSCSSRHRARFRAPGARGRTSVTPGESGRAPSGLPGDS